MALEAGRQSASPTSSGRASPISRKWNSQIAAGTVLLCAARIFPELTPGLDEPPSKDKAFRRYASGVERSLSLFDTALQEWADYISFLARLLKVLRRDQAALSSKMKKLI
jgi:Dopey, N-terminal